MKTKALLITLIVSIALITACTNKKKTEDNVETEVISEESKTVTEDTTDEDEVRRLDSIRQVKEHGHAH